MQTPQSEYNNASFIELRAHYYHTELANSYISGNIERYLRVLETIMGERSDLFKKEEIELATSNIDAARKKASWPKTYKQAAWKHAQEAQMLIINVLSARGAHSKHKKDLRGATRGS